MFRSMPVFRSGSASIADISASDMKILGAEGSLGLGEVEAVVLVPVAILDLRYLYDISITFLRIQYLYDIAYTYPTYRVYVYITYTYTYCRP